MPKRLLEPILDGGIRHVHFFNGRRLTAEDLTDEQKANREGREQIGRAVGYGVVSGFEVLEADSGDGDAAGIEGFGGVTGQPVVLTVRAGLAINSIGQPVALAQDQQLALVMPDQLPEEGAGVFADCETLTPVEIGSGSGAYVLTARPASGFSESASMSDFGAKGRITGCGSRYAVEGVTFRLLPVSLYAEPVTPMGTLRNRLAHLFFGTGRTYKAAPEPYPMDWFTQDPIVPDMDAVDVPLASLYWSEGKVRMLDHWSVRRRVVSPYPPSPITAWWLHVTETRIATAEAMFLQFQDEIWSLTQQETGLGGMRANERFRYLPAAGVLPVGHNEFSAETFFHRQLFPRQTDVEGDGAFLREWLHRSWFVDPIDVLAPPPITIYRLSDTDDYVVFTRQEASSLALSSSDEAAAPETTEAQGVIEVDVALADDFAAEGGTELLGLVRSADRKEAMLALARNLRVTALDETGRSYDAELVRTGGVYEISTKKRFARLAIASLPKGEYVVSIKATGFRTAQKRVTLPAGGRERILFQLVPGRKRGGGKKGVAHKPSGTAKGDWIDPGWYKKVKVVDTYVDPSPLDDVKGWDPVTDPPPEVAEWLLSWADWTASELPEAPVDPGDIQILVHPDYVPDAAWETPYAHVLFGENGAHAPLMLIPNHRAVKTTVSARGAGVVGVDEDVNARLMELGASEVDVLGAAWTGLLLDAGFTEATAKIVQSDAKAKAAELQTSVRGVFGVDDQLASALTEKGIDTSVKLANADAGTLVEAFGLSDSAAHLLIGEARNLVPEESWSLGAAGLKLSGTQVKLLEEEGVTSLGGLAEKSAEEVAGMLEMSTGDAAALVSKAAEGSDSERTKTRLAEEAAITLLREESGVTMSDADVKNLAAAGVSTLGAVAAMDLNTVTAIVGDQATAESLVGAAKTRIGL